MVPEEYGNTSASDDLRAFSYIRERWEPQPGDADYMQLADLRLALERFRTESEICVLDYGCGGSPYQALFPNADFRRADYGYGDSLDYVIGSNGRIEEKDATFDVVFSTQVAEHVASPRNYFEECFRLLRPGGRFICSTHGSYIDHGCPHDFQRWTAEGLSRDLRASGFEIDQMLKLTTGPRALIYLFDRFQNWLALSRTIPFGFALWVIRRLMQRFRPTVHSQCDRHFAVHRVVEDGIGQPEHSLYVVLLAVAVRPQQ